MIEIHPSGHMTLIQRRLNVDATSWRCIDVEPTLYKRYVPAGIFSLPKKIRAFKQVITKRGICELYMPNARVHCLNRTHCSLLFFFLFLFVLFVFFFFFFFFCVFCLFVVVVVVVVFVLFCFLLFFFFFFFCFFLIYKFHLMYARNSASLVRTDAWKERNKGVFCNNSGNLFYFSINRLCCEYSLEAPHWEASHNNRLA